MKKQSTKAGVFIMTLANFINKGIGAVYTILLVYLLTSKGMGILNNALNNYTTLVVSFTTGFSAALAKIISENMSLGKYRHAHRVFKTSFYLFIAIGILSAIVMYYMSVALAIGPEVHYSIYVLMPALFFAAISTVFRGYFQGMRYVTPIATAQLFEQISKIAVAVILTGFFMPNLPLAAFGAASGVTVGAVISLGVLALSYIGIRKNLYRNIREDRDSDRALRSRDIIKHTLGYAVPISLGGTIIQFIGNIDQFVVNKLFPLVGYTTDQITMLFGIYTGEVIKLIDIPSILTIAVAVNMLPAVASAFAAQNFTEIRRKAVVSYRVVALISVPSAVGLSLLAEPLIRLIYINETHPYIAGSTLSIFAIAIIFISIIQVSTSILQGVSRIYRPIKNILIGLVIKVLSSGLIFIIPEHGIQVVAFGTVLCYACAAMLNARDVKKYTGLKHGILRQAGRPLLASAFMAVFVALAYNYTMVYVQINAIAVPAAIVAGILSYAAALYAIGGYKGKEGILSYFK